MDDVLVSVCVLTYNHELFLTESLDSILLQKTNFPFQVIIADDFSTDNSRRILLDYKEKYPDKIKLLFQKSNVGVIKNFTDLLRAASSKYIAICESDDYWIDFHKLQKQVDILDKCPEYSMVCSNRLIIELNGDKSEDKFYTKDVYTIKDIVDGFIPGTQTVMFRNYDALTSFFEKHKEIYSGDRYLSYFCSLMGDIFKMPDVTAAYRITGKGVWSKKSELEKLKHVTDQMIGFHASLGLPFNNEILATKSFNNSVAFMTYFIKRPHMLFKEGNSAYIFRPFIKFSKMNRFSFFFKSIFNKIKNG